MVGSFFLVILSTSHLSGLNSIDQLDSIVQVYAGQPVRFLDLRDNL